MKVIPLPTSDNSTASNSTDEVGSGEVAEEEGSSRRKKRQTEESEDTKTSSENSMGETSITIVEDSECDEAFKYVN